MRQVSVARLKQSVPALMGHITVIGTREHGKQSYGDTKHLVEHVQDAG